MNGLLLLLYYWLDMNFAAICMSSQSKYISDESINQ